MSQLNQGGQISPGEEGITPIDDADSGFAGPFNNDLPFIPLPWFPEGAGSFATVRYEFDGATTDFAITFPYLGQENFVGGGGKASEFIHVFIGNNPASGWHMPDNSTVRFDSPIVSGTLTIRRYTPIGKRQVDYQGGSTLSERNLDRDKIEDTYKFQENLDRLWEIYQFLGPPDYIKHFERISDGATATFTLFDSEEINETAIVREAEVLVRVGGAHLLPGDYQLGKDGDGYVTVTLDEMPPSGVLITFTTLTSGDPQTIDVNLVIPDGSIGWEKLTPPLLTRQTWPILVDIDDGAAANAADGQVLIWDGDGGGTTSLSQRTLDHNDITDFDAGVRQNSITSLAAPTIALSMASHRITNLSDGINPTDAATVGQISAFGEVFESVEKIVPSAFPATLRSGLSNGTWLVWVRGQLQGAGNGANITVTLTLNGVTRDHNVGNYPDGTAPWTIGAVVTVTDGTITISGGGMNRVEGAIGLRVG